MKTCVVIPAFNEQDSIGAVLDDLTRLYPEITPIVVDDASTDLTSERVAAGSAVLLRLPANLGIGGAVQTGLRYAVAHGFEAAVQVDGDGQHPVNQLDLLLDPIRQGEADVVIGSRFLQSGEYRAAVWRNVGIVILRTVISILAGQRITDTTSGFRAYGREAMALLAEHYPQDYPEPEAVVELARNRMKIVEVPVQMKERTSGRSSIRGLRGMYYMTKVTLAALVAATRMPVRRKEQTDDGD